MMNSFIYSDDMLSRMKSHLNDNTNRFITYPKFVFLCGQAYSDREYSTSNRGIIDKYLHARSNAVHIVLSEKLWEEGFNSNIDLLTFEEFLAEVSDRIILFVESPGSFCELGAFAYADKLFSDKLIIVIDRQYEGAKSFIMTGPTAKAKKDGAKIVFAPLEGNGLLSSAELRQVIDNTLAEFSGRNATANKRIPNKYENQVRVNSFILELLELLQILQPITRDDLLCVYKKVKGFVNFQFVKKDGNPFHNEIKYDYIIKLLETVNLISVTNDLITLCSQIDTQQLMFNYSKVAENRERNRLICRKYRYRGL